MVLGAFLLVVDVVLINVYFLIWFGLSGLLVGLLLALVPELPQWLQITAFTAFGAGLLGIWLFLLKPRKRTQDIQKAQSDMPGQSAVVVRFSNGTGKMRLQRPIGGRDVWEFAFQGNVRPGDRLSVVSVSSEGVVSVALEGKPHSPPLLEKQQ